MSDPIHNLPHLRANHNVPKIDTSGLWTSINVNLETVAAALPVDPNVVFVDEDEPIRAIPDPWAQATAFAEALRKSLRTDRKKANRSGLALRALGQWRGLLALLALQHEHSKDFTLRPQRVDLNDQSHFSTVLTTLTPEVAIEGCAGLWREPTLIMLQLAGDSAGLFERPLAMTNPVCLVSPGRSSHRIEVPNIQWAQGDLGDPLAPGSPKLSMLELSILYHYLAGLIRAMSERSGEIASDIGRLLENYAKDAQGALNRQADAALPSSNQQLGEAELFRPLWNQYKIDPSIAPLDRRSEAIIKTRAPLKPAGEPGQQKTVVEGFILVDQAVAEAYGRDPSEILIWGRTDLASLLKSEAKLGEVRTAAAKEGYVVLTANDLLTTRAARLKKRALIDSHPDGLKEMILPVCPLALLMASDLKAAVSGGTAGDRAMITLRLRLDDGSNDGRAIQLTRHYALNPSEKGEFLLVDAEDWDIYNCQVWPNFRSPAWNSYLARFLYVTAYTDKITRPNQAVSADLLREAIAQSGDCSGAAKVLREFNSAKKVPVRGGSSEAPLFRYLERLTGENNGFREEIQFSSKAFDAIYYVDALGDERSEAPVGMVLLDLQRFEKPERTTKIAIDFGTTNTVAAIGSMRAPPVTFANRLLLPVRHADEAIHEIAVHNTRHQFTDFLPPEERATPIPSVAIPKLPYNSEETLWALRNLIFFYTAQPPSKGGEARELNEFLKSTADARFNLKWSQVSEERDAAKDFLTQFMVMTAAELVSHGFDPAKSKWYFSVPEAFSTKARGDFQQAIEESSRAIGQVPGETHYSPLLSEGLAAGQYMLDTEQFISDKLNVILDIGGGTTDITIWNADVPVWRGSVRLAGRNFFTSLLVQNSQILEKIGLGGWARSLNAFKQHRDPGDAGERRKQMAEMLFSGRSSDGERPDLQRALSDFWGRIGGQDGEPLRFAALTYLAGVAWYVGKVVRQLMRDGLLGSYDEETQTGEAYALVSDAAFAVCGRGGGIFQMMHGARRAADAETEVTRALSVFGRSLGIDDCERPRFSASDAAKLEVVRGMLNIEDAEDEERLKAEAIHGLSSIMPAALRLKHADGEIGPDSLITGASLPKKVQSVDMAEFSEFLSALEACTDITIDIDPSARESAHGRIAAAVSKQVQDMRANHDKAPPKQKERVGLEPPFVVALRSLIDIMAMPSEDKEGLLQVWGAE